MAPQSPTSRPHGDLSPFEATQRAPLAPPMSSYLGRLTPYQRYEASHHDDYDDRAYVSRPAYHGHPQVRGGHRTPGETVGLARFKRSAAELECESSPIATPVRLPTIDALCGASTKRRLSGVTSSRLASSPFTRGTPPTNNSPSIRPTETPSPESTRPPSRTSSTADDGDEEQPVVVRTTAAEPTPPTKKRQRYLRDVDRRSIILRIENGEKQAALAREFGVTRAAICHIKKNRDEIVSRYESLLQSAKEMERAGMALTHETKAIPSSVVELTRPSVLLLLTTLRDVTTSRRAFRAAANRLMMILLEEALASVATVACDLRTTNGQTMRGVRPDRRACCVAVGVKGLPLVKLHREIDPTASVGYIHMTTMESHDGLAVGRVELPREMAASPDTPTLLVTCSTASGQSVCAAIDALLDAGVPEENIRVVALACTTGAVEAISSQFPGVRILTCAVEATTSESAATSTTLSDFLERYSGAVKAKPPLADEPSRRHSRPQVSEDWRDEDDEGQSPFRHHHATCDSRTFR